MVAAICWILLCMWTWRDDATVDVDASGGSNTLVAMILVASSSA